jgi:hypothetical protein
MVEDGSIVSAGLVAERTPDPTLADAGRTSVTMPGVRRSKYGSIIRFILDAVSLCRLCSVDGLLAKTIWSSCSTTAPWLLFLAG